VLQGLEPLPDLTVARTNRLVEAWKAPRRH
jgi:hypothetical protein